MLRFLLSISLFWIASGSFSCTLQYCNDNNPCTLDSCLQTGACFHKPLCDDNNNCTVDTCNNGVCTNTNDTDRCATTDKCVVWWCDPVYGCLYKVKGTKRDASSLADCDDGDLCTLDSCNSATGCVNTPVTCNDGNVCTDDYCEGGYCKTRPTNCDDGNSCTTDTCSIISGCIHTFNLCGGSKCTTTSCNDHNACTTDTCNTSTGCTFPTITCDDGNYCTDDYCDFPTQTCKTRPANLYCPPGNIPCLLRRSQCSS